MDIGQLVEQNTLVLKRSFIHSFSRGRERDDQFSLVKCSVTLLGQTISGSNFPPSCVPFKLRHFLVNFNGRIILAQAFRKHYSSLF